MCRFGLTQFSFSFEHVVAAVCVCMTGCLCHTFLAFSGCGVSDLPVMFYGVLHNLIYEDICVIWQL